MDKNQFKKGNDDPVSEDKEFNSFFLKYCNDFLTKPQRLYRIHMKIEIQADKIFFKSRSNLDQVFDTFLTGVDQQTAQKCHRIIHAASLSAAIVGCSPIPFSDAFLLVPIQLTMMSRLHKLFGQSWSEGLGKSLSKELVVVGLGRSAVGNIIKFIPAVGTVSGAVINASVAVSITEALGWVTVKMLNDGEDIFEQAMSFRGQFEILFKALRK